MPTFTVSLIASIPVSAQVVIEADNEAQALAIAQQMHQRAQLGWTYNGLPIPTFTGPVASIWSNPGVIAPPGPKKVSIVLVVNPTTVPFGSPVICTATVAPGATGLVSFYDGLTLIDTAVPNGFGIATLSGVELPIGVQEIVAKFAGDIYFAAGISNTVRVVVTPPATATVCIGSPNPQDFGSVVHITATTTSAFGVPTGLVIFYDGATQIGSAKLSAGTCSINTAALAIGSHQLKAVYQGSGEFAGSTSLPFTEVIESALTPTTTVVISSAPNAIQGALVIFTATVSPIAGPFSTGIITFTAVPTVGPSTDLGSPSVNGSGIASVSTSTLPVGVYTIQAIYSGNSTFASSTGTTSQVITAPTSVFWDILGTVRSVLGTFQVGKIPPS